MWRRCFVSIALVVCSMNVRAADTEVAAILALRADSNAGLLAHDVDRVLLHTTDDFILVGGTSGGHVGKAMIRRYYIDGFANPDLVTYIRTPDQVTV